MQGDTAPGNSGAGSSIVIAFFLIIILYCIEVVLQPKSFKILQCNLHTKINTRPPQDGAFIHVNTFWPVISKWYLTYTKALYCHIH